MGDTIALELKKTLQSWLGQLTPARRIDPQERERLLAMMQSARQSDRWRAAGGLSAGDPGQEGVAALASVLHDPDPILRWEAAEALARIDTSAAQGALLEALLEGKPEAQAVAADALGNLPATPHTLAALLAALSNRQEGVRQSAAEALARLAARPAPEDAPRPGPELQPVLADLLASDKDPMVRRAAALALGRLGDPGARQVLEARQSDPRENSLVRQAANEALGRLHEPPPPVEPPPATPPANEA